MPRCRCLLHYSSFIMSAMDYELQNALNMQALKMIQRSAATFIEASVSVQKNIIHDNRKYTLIFASCVSIKYTQT